MAASDDSEELSAAEALFEEFLKSEGADFAEFVAAHPEQADELEALFGTWQVVEALGTSRRQGQSAADVTLQLGERYSGVAEIARGGMGVVYRARDERLGREIALKVQRGTSSETGTDRSNRFHTEARISAQLDHPGIVPVHELDQDEGGCLYFTMRFVEGRTLHELFEHVKAAEDGWSTTRALGVLVRICETLAFAHSRGVVHRDLKPRNVMVGQFGEVYIMDWGVAKVLGEPESGPELAADTPTTPPCGTHAGEVMGTPAYMAPEQAEDSSRVDPRADVYALGAILYELVAGQCPYRDRVAGTEVLTLLRSGAPTSLSKLCPNAPPELVAICNRAMEREPGARYASAQEMRADLSAYLEQRVVRAYRTGFWSELAKWYARNRRQAQALVGGALIAVIGLSTAVVLLNRKNVELQGTNERLDEALTAAESQGYSTNLASAQQLLGAGDTHAARQRLDACPPHLRGWEWEYMNVRLDSSLARIEIEPPTIISAARWDRAGGRVVYGTFARELVVHDLSDPSAPVTRLQGGRKRISAIDFDPQRPGRAVSGHVDGALIGWDLEGGVQTERVVAGSSVHALGFALDGRLAVGVGRDLQLRSESLWLSRTIPAHTADITSLAWDPAQKRIATTSQDGTVAVWDVAQGTELARFEVAPAQDLGRFPSQVCWSPSGEHLAAAFPTGVWCVFGTDDWRELARVTTDYWTFSVEFSTEDVLVVGGTDVLEAWDWRAEEPLRAWPGARGKPFDLQRQGDQLLTVEPDLGLTWFSLREIRRETLTGHQEDITAVALQPGGQLIATASRDDTARLWQVADGTCVRVFDELPVMRDSIAWADESTVLAGLSDGSVAEWDIETGDLLDRWSLGKRPVRALCTSPDGRFAFAQDFRGALRVWDREDRLLLATLEVARHWFKPAISLDGLRLAVVGPSQRTIELRSLPDLALLRTLEGMHDDRINSVSFSSDGSRLVSAGRDLRVVVWNLQTDGTAVLRGHAREVFDAIFFEDDTRIATGGAGREIKIWDVEAGESVATLFGHESWVLDLDVSEDERVLVSSSSDRTLRVWSPASPW